jgi:ribosomal protein S12 methylthiotransferase accessory factor
MVSAIDFLRSGKPVALRDGGTSANPEEGVGDLERVVALFASRGLDVIAVDLTAPDVEQCGYCVTKVLVPGLQPLEGDHSHRFLGGSRLYDVPVELGLRATAASLEDLNPDPHPYP